ncbi:hypothetical protein BSZ35_13875 [Salinibacter sp. 10B]|nr:hypothetical protein BSZ35_13875 [Salinibacter sp. 10B]
MAGGEEPLPGGTARSTTVDQSRWQGLLQWGARWGAPAFLMMWAGGVLLFLGRLGVGMVTLWRWRRSTTKLAYDDLVGTLVEQLSLSRSVSVRCSAQAQVPTVWGIWAPTVLLPAEASEWSRARLRSVLLHELAHVKRWDALTHIVSRIARAFFWPNPMVWRAAAQATAAQERACDDTVLLRGGVASWEYAEQLLAVTKTLRRGPVPVDAVALDAGRQFKSRMRALLKSSAPRRRLTRREIGGVCSVGGLFLVAVSLVQVGPEQQEPNRGQQYWLEAERGALPAAFATESDEGASERAYVTVREGGALDRPPQEERGAYVFDVEEAGRHLIWARVRVPSDAHNSLWVRMDSTRWIRWNGIEQGEQWHWVQVRDADQEGQPVAFELSEGQHRLQLGPREDQIDIDQLVVTNDWQYRPPTTDSDVSSDRAPTQVWLEAEEGQLELPLRVGHSPQASGWQHIVAQPEEQRLDAPPANGRVSYSFTVPRSGTYRIWGRIVAASTGSDSFWIRMDEGRWIRWNEIRPGERWHWDQVHDADAENAPVQFDLAAGTHQLTVAYREQHAKLDRLLITSSPTYRPRGTGRRPEGSTPFSQMLPLSKATLTSPMVRADSAAPVSGIGVPDGPGNDAYNSGPGAATWTFTVPREGEYVFWGEVRAPAPNDNSFYVSVDGGKDIAWHIPAPNATTEGWTWDPVSRLKEGEHTDPVIFSLEAGTHQLRLRNREDGTRLRRLRVTNRSATGLRVVRP